MFEATNSGDSLKQRAKPVGPVRDVGGQADKDKHRQRNQRTTACQGIDKTGGETGGDYDSVQIPFQIAVAFGVEAIDALTG